MSFDFVRSSTRSFRDRVCWRVVEVTNAGEGSAFAFLAFDLLMLVVRCELMLPRDGSGGWNGCVTGTGSTRIRPGPGTVGRYGITTGSVDRWWSER